MDDRKHIKTPVAIFLDLSKAFDTLNFDILLHKLQYYGISGVPLSLMKSYLSNRFQYVKYNNFDSSLLEINAGIPQGSILGPLFFSIYINDLVFSSNKLSYLLYADDTTLYFNLEDFDKQYLERDITNELNQINVWLKMNKLSLNAEKTKLMVFHVKQRKVAPISIHINNTKIENVEYFNFLGIYLDKSICWKNHINMLTTKLSKIVGICNRLKSIYPEHVLLTIYNSLFVSQINYGLLLWGTKLEPIFKIQKKAIRTLTNQTYIAHSERLLIRTFKSI